MRIIRLILGTLILFFDWLFAPRGIRRDPAVQARLDGETASLKLYQYQACPFCVKVRRWLKRNSLNIEIRDALRCDQSREELLREGGKLQVPCLRIEDDRGGVNWMYESRDIIGYLESRFATA